MSYELRKTRGVFCPNVEICMGCFVHVILLGVGCFVSLQNNMWWFLSTYNKMDVGGYVRGVFYPYTGGDLPVSTLYKLLTIKICISRQLYFLFKWDMLS